MAARKPSPAMADLELLAQKRFGPGPAKAKEDPTLVPPEPEPAPELEPSEPEPEPEEPEPELEQSEPEGDSEVEAPPEVTPAASPAWLQGFGVGMPAQWTSAN